jgi:dTDP-4-amino-4,6-dideoxygalactose transaminase
MLSFIENKKIDWNNIQNIVKASEKVNQWSNFGPVSLYLESKIKEIANTNYSVVACANGTIALHALIELYSYIKQRELTWVTSSFGFPSVMIGPLKNVKIVDCDLDGLLDLSSLPDCDGMIVTNPFGTAGSLEMYRDYCQHNHKILVVDSATALLDNHLPNTMVSFHHTKPWGFGEGGCVIVEKQHEAFIRSLLNFGLVDNVPVGNHATNGKMSEISAAFIVDRLSCINCFKNEYVEQYDRIAKIAKNYGFSIFGRQKPLLPTNVALLSKKPFVMTNPYICLKKYYKPLVATPVASSIYKSILNFPCHKDVADLSDSDISDCFKIITEN